MTEPILNIRLLGTFEVTYAGITIGALNTPRLRSLLTALVLQSGVPHVRAQLAFSLWPDSVEAQAYTNLRRLVHRLVQVLPNAQRFLHRDRHSLMWRADAPCQVDVVEFESLIDEAEECVDTPTRRLTLERALKLWGGELLPGCYEDWLHEEKHRLQNKYCRILTTLISLAEYDRDYQAAIGFGEELFRADPTSEEVCCTLMRLHAATGNRNGIVRIYKKCSMQLRKELDVEPGEGIRAVYRRLCKSPQKPSKGTSGNPPLIGRRDEWESLCRVWEEVAEGAFKAVILKGESGVGKTRLAEEFVAWVRRQRYTILTARCYPIGNGSAYGPITDWLRGDPVREVVDGLDSGWRSEIRRLAPEVAEGEIEPQPLTERWQQQRFFEALRIAITAVEQPLMLFLDDLQYADRESLAWIHYLFGRSHTDRILLLSTLGPQEPVGKEPLTQLNLSLKRAGACLELQVPPLNKNETDALASHLWEGEASADQLALLYRETEGNPLFIIEAILSGIATKGTIASADLPQSVQASILRCLTQVSSGAQDLLDLAAVIGRSFEFPLLISAGKELGNEMLWLRCLEEVLDRYILREQDNGTYEFCHGKIREVIYARLSKARCRTLHQWVGEALSQQNTNEQGAMSKRLAYHFHQGGLPDRAVPYYLQAADEAVQIHAHGDAQLALERCLDLLDTNGKPYMRTEVLEKLGDIHVYLGQYDLAEQSYLEGISSLPDDSPLQVAGLWVKMAAMHSAYRQVKEANDACDTAEQTLQAVYTEPKALWASTWIDMQLERTYAYYLQGSWQKLAVLAKEIEGILADYGNPLQRVKFLFTLAQMHLRQERFVPSHKTLALVKEHYARALELGDEIQYQQGHFNIGFCHLWRGEIKEALLTLRKCLRRARQTGYEYIAILSMVYLSIAWQKAGRVDRARTCGIHAMNMAQQTSNIGYYAAAKGILAWVAWREKDLSQARSYAECALKNWEQSDLVYPFEWLARFPLLGVALAEDRLEEALEQTAALLDTRQAALSPHITEILHHALNGYGEETRTYLQKAVKLAIAQGYL